MSYRRKHVKNKINKSRPKKSIFKMAIFWWSLLVLIVIAVGIYFFLFFPNFQIQNISINGVETINSQDIQNIISNNVNKKLLELGNWNLPSKSIFLTNTQDIQNKIASLYPNIKTITVTKKFPQDLDVSIQERQLFATFSQNNKYFYIDDSGIIFEEIPNVAENTFIVRQSLNTNDIWLGESVVQENVMKTISEIAKNLKDNFQINLTEALISTPIRLDVKTGENWQIYFDITENSDISLQLTKLNLLLKDEITPEARQKLEYIDLRFKDRAYYK